MNLHFAIPALIAVAVCAPAQQLPTPAVLLPRVNAYAQDYRQRVPSFEADESAVTQALKAGRVTWEVRLEMTLREMKNPSLPGGLRDSYVFRSVDGNPPKRRFKIPYFVEGVFNNAIGFANNSQESCYDYRVSPGPEPSTVQLELWQKKQNPVPPNCIDVLEDYRKTLLVDAISGRVLHVTRSMSQQAAKEHHDIPYVEVDYAPQKLGDETFWLPVRFVSHDSSNQRRMTGTYSNFHRYSATATILNSTPIPDQQQESLPLK